MLMLYLISDTKTLSIIQSIGSIAIVLSATVAIFTYLRTKKEESSKVKLDFCLGMFEKAYEVFTNKNDELIPLNDRMVWLTTARLITTAMKASCEITSTSYKSIYEDYEFYWRTKFYNYLEKHKSDMDKRYYAEKPEDALCTDIEDRQPLAEESLVVIYRFIKWKEGYVDKIRGIGTFTQNEIEGFNIGYTGLSDHITEFRSYSDKGSKYSLERLLL